MSVEHLGLAIIGSDLHLKNLGRNGTLIAVKGKGEQRLKLLMTGMPGKALENAVLTLADFRGVAHFTHRITQDNPLSIVQEPANTSNVEVLVNS